MRTLSACYNGSLVTDTDVHDLQEVLAQPGGLIWLDITDPTPEDTALLREQFGIHPLAVEDAVHAHERPKVERYDEAYFVIFYAARYDHDAESVEFQALHLFIGRNYLVTVHRSGLRQVEETLARWHAPNCPLERRVGPLVYALLDAVIDDYFPILDRIADQIDALEAQIFVPDVDRQVAGGASTQLIFLLKKNLLNFRRMLAPERDVLNVLLRREHPIFRPEDAPYLQDLYDHVVRLTENTDLYRDLLSSALDSYLSYQSNNLNQILKILTVASIVLMSNALIAGIYGMNFANMPELTWQYGYPFALLLMGLVSAGLIFFFRLKRWL